MDASLEDTDEVGRHHQEIVATKRGRPAAKGVPLEPGPPPTVLGILACSGKSVGDILSPAELWE